MIIIEILIIRYHLNYCLKQCFKIFNLLAKLENEGLLGQYLFDSLIIMITLKLITLIYSINFYNSFELEHLSIN